MRYLPGLLAVALLAIAAVATGAEQRHHSPLMPCEQGTVKAYAVVTGNRLSGPGGIPSFQTAAGQYFARRYNCTGRGLPTVRRVDLGVYEVRFPGQEAAMATVAAYNDRATSGSVLPLGDGTWRVYLRGSRIENGVMLATDAAFAIVLA